MPEVLAHCLVDMTLRLFLCFLPILIKFSLGGTVEANDTIARNAASATTSTETPGLHQSPWVVCNAPPRYNIPLDRNQCQEAYNRIIKSPSSISMQGWYGIHTPVTLTKESDSCVIRLETNYRNRSEVVSPATIAYVASSISRKCILGGVASIGDKYFYVSVTRMIPGEGSENGASGLPLTSTS